MRVELTDRQRQRIAFAGRILGVMGASRGEHPCVSFCTAEDGFSARFHACFCTPGTIQIFRLGEGDDVQRDEA